MYLSSACLAAALLLTLGLSSRPAQAEEAPAIGHKQSAWKRAGNGKAIMEFGAGYRSFIDSFRTEREVVGAGLAEARRRGYVDLLADKRPTRSAFKAGATFVASQHGKIAAFIVLGKQPLSKGLHVVAAHIDSVRIDLKQTPVYADANLGLLQTHYYGDIKSYQWLSQPLQLRGVVVRKDGTRVEVAIGDDSSEPVLVIPDIAVHLSRHVDGKEGEQVPGESLDPIVSSTPARGKSADPFATQAARLLESELGIKIRDLASAELSLVPAHAARDVGLDRAMIGGYGQDDRAGAYAALQALLATKSPEHTAIVVWVDKEEVGSGGNSGAQSTFLPRVVAELLEGQGQSSSAAAMNQVFSSSMVFSAGVSGAANPHYPSLYDAKNAAFAGSGVIWDQSAANADVLGYVRRLFDREKIAHQASNWGKTVGSKGDGHTVLGLFTRLGMDGLDVSIPLLSMHSTYELISKVDLFEAFRGYRAFLKE